VAKALSKELKQPDEFVSFWTHLGAKLSQHRTKVITVLVATAVAFGGGWALSTYRAAQSAKATAAFDRIDAIAAADLLPEKPEKSEKGDDAKANEAKTEDDGIPRFKTEKERLEAANKEADSFIATFGSAGIGRKALFGKASRLVALGKPDEAVTIYNDLAGSETDPDVRPMEQEGAGAAYEAAGKLDEALRVYSALADASAARNFYLDRALFAKARVLEKQGKAKDAEQVLRDILSKVPKSSLRQQIDDRLAVLTEK
jgi:tetratricopeptide (TPR) repeat protein